MTQTLSNLLNPDHKEKSKKKPIEFKFYIDDYTPEVTNISYTLPTEWKNIILLSKGLSKDKYDIMYAYDDNSEDGIVYIGYWNDGVKE